MKQLTLALTLLAIILLSACGTLQVSIDDETVEPTPPITVVTIPAQPTTSEPTLTAEATDLAVQPAAPEEPQATPASTPADTPEAEESGGPAGWERYHNEAFGITLYHPQGTVVEEMEPSTLESWREGLAEPIVEEQVFFAVVFQASDQRGILEIKLVANSDGRDVGTFADTISQRCEEIIEPPTETTVNVHVSGFRYSCMGMFPITEIWSGIRHGNDPLFGASWAAANIPLAEEILATISFDMNG